MSTAIVPRRTRDVLFVVHNEIMFSHAVACHQAIRGDARIRSWFCLTNPDLCFDAPALASRRDAAFLPVEEAKARAWDLIIFADHDAGFAHICPTIYLGHGHYAGKSVDGSDYVVGAWARDDRGALRYDKIFRPSEFMAQAARRQHPDAADHVRVVGSLFGDALRRAGGARPTAPKAWGFDPARLTVFVATTWGRGSVVQSQRDAFHRGVAELASRHNVIVSVHLNNFKAAHGNPLSWDAFKRGLATGPVRVVSPREESYQLLPLADVLVMELTSLGFYYAALGRPIVYYDNPGIPYLPTSLAEEMKRAAHVIDGFSGLNAHVEQARDAFDPEAMRHVAERAFDHPGEARIRHHLEICDSLGLTPPRDWRRVKRAALFGLALAVGLVGWAWTARERSATGERLWTRAVAAHAAVLDDPSRAAPAQAEAAARDLEAVLRARPGTVWAARALEAIGLLRFGRGEYESARAAFHRLVWTHHQFKSQVLTALIHIGRSYEREGRWDEAVEAYNEIASHHPWTDTWMEAPLYAADVYARRGDPEAADAVRRRAASVYLQRIAVAPNAVWGIKARGQLVLAYRALGEEAKLARLTEELADIRQTIRRADVLMTLGRTYARQLNDPATARACYEQLLREFPADPLAPYARQELAELPPAATP